jgi:hypothetical protein
MFEGGARGLWRAGWNREDHALRTGKDS